MFKKKFIVRLLIIAGLSFITGYLYNEHTSDPKNIQKVKDLPKFGKFINNVKKFKPLVRIYDSEGSCSATVIDSQYLVTAAHCVYNDDYRLKKSSKYYVFSTDNVDTEVTAKPVFMNISMDIALMKGDFKDFETLPIDTKGIMPIIPNIPYMSCGYPMGRPEPRCVTLFYVGNLNFFYSFIGGLIFQGMSGGPVVDVITGNLIGVNSAVYDNRTIIAPVITLFHQAGIE